MANKKKKLQLSIKRMTYMDMMTSFIRLEDEDKKLVMALIQNLAGK